MARNTSKQRDVSVVHTIAKALCLLLSLLSLLHYYYLSLLNINITI